MGPWCGWVTKWLHSTQGKTWFIPGNHQLSRKWPRHQDINHTPFARVSIRKQRTNRLLPRGWTGNPNMARRRSWWKRDFDSSLLMERFLPASSSQQSGDEPKRLELYWRLLWSRIRNRALVAWWEYSRSQVYRKKNGASDAVFYPNRSLSNGWTCSLLPRKSCRPSYFCRIRWARDCVRCWWNCPRR